MKSYVSYDQNSPVGAFHKLTQESGHTGLDVDEYDTRWEPFRRDLLGRQITFTEPTEVQLIAYMKRDSEDLEYRLKKDLAIAAGKKSGMGYTEQHEALPAAKGLCAFLGKLKAEEVSKHIHKYKYMSKQHAYELIRSLEERTMSHRSANHISVETNGKSSGYISGSTGPSTSVQRGLIFNRVTTHSGGRFSGSFTADSESVTKEVGHGVAQAELELTLAYMYFVRPQIAGGKLLTDAAIEEKLRVVNLAWAASKYSSLEQAISYNPHTNYAVQRQLIADGRDKLFAGIDSNKDNWLDDPETTW